MINTDIAYGIVLFGVRNDGTVCGIEPGNLDMAQRTLSQTIASRFEPQINAEIELESQNDKRVLILTATRSRNVPYNEFEGLAWIRQGTETRKLSLSQKQQLERKRNRDLHNGPWKCEQCGSVVGMLLSIRMTNEDIEKSYRCSCGGEFWPI